MSKLLPRVTRGQRRLPIGAELVDSGQAHFRVWAPVAKTVHVVIENKAVALEQEEAGYFSGTAPARAGTLYQYQINGEKRYPDPASRFQPEGPHGPSCMVDPTTFSWTDRDWKGVEPSKIVLYELHIGTFTAAGTWQAAAAELEELADLGITMVEVMPVADFPGRFGWGYDGVNLFAPTRLYGRPDDFRAFIDRAHSLGVGVILDVVYNHFGPDGNYLQSFSPTYFSERYKNEWGEAINFDGPGSDAVREFFIANAGFWIDEYHLDGLRLDATQQIFDSSPEPIVREITARVREVARGRRTYVVAENEPQNSDFVRPVEDGGNALDALWNDDFHHSAMVALTGKNPAYYSDYNGKPQELISAMKWGFLYQGQRYSWQKNPRGLPSLDLRPHHFVAFLQNHDQVANSRQGLPLNRLTSPGRLRALTAYLLLGPATPMLFQGQEFGSSRCFLYFADHNPELAKLVAKGRAEFLMQFPTLKGSSAQATLANPADLETFVQCKLDLAERSRNAGTYALHRDLLALRRTDSTFAGNPVRPMEGSVLSDQAFVVRYFGAAGADRLVIVNLGNDLKLASIAEPLMAPPRDKEWTLLWSSDDVRYGGDGTHALTEEEWFLPGEAAIVLAPMAKRPANEKNS